jgi:predicted enzyme related to lactoylglutathione lyase
VQHDHSDAAGRLVCVVIDALEPDRLARFWAHALGWSVGPTTAVGVELLPGDETGFHVVLRPTPAAKAGQNRIHVDLTTRTADDQRRTVDELLALGACHVDIGQGPEETHVVLADPEGNELCVIEPTNRFLASCPRLGAVNCDGTRALGQFYAAALGWPLVWDQDEETAIQRPDGRGPKVTWSGPPLMPRHGLDRLHLHVGPGDDHGDDATDDGDVDATVERLLALGARHMPEARACPGAVALADVDGNQICVVG